MSTGTLMLSIFLSIFASSHPSQAYVIDDTDSIVQYSGRVAWVPLPNGSGVFDPNKLSNSSVTYGWCLSSHNCHIQLPFTGSGVTVYNVIHGQVNASFSVDGGSTASFVHDKSCVSNCCYNVSVYDIQSLENGHHMLDMMLLDYNGGDGEFAFDYAVVNGMDAVPVITIATPTPIPITSSTINPQPPITISLVSTHTTSHLPATTTPSITNLPAKTTRLDAIIAGIFGGIATLAAILVMVLYFWRRNNTPTTKRRHKYNTTAASRLPRALSPPLESEWTNGASLSDIPYNSADAQHTRKEAIAVPRRPTSPRLGNQTQPTIGDLPPTARDTEPSKARMMAEAETATQRHTSLLTEENTESENYGLTALQIRMIAQRLLRENIPNSVVVTLVDRMIQSSSGDDDDLRGAALRDSQVEPPGYDSL